MLSNVSILLVFLAISRIYGNSRFKKMDPADKIKGDNRLLAFRQAAKLGLRDDIKSLVEPGPAGFVVHNSGNELRNEEAIDFLISKIEQVELVYASPGATDLECQLKKDKIIFEFNEEGEQKLKTLVYLHKFIEDGVVDQIVEQEEEEDY